jgi:hypothetical protein
MTTTAFSERRADRRRRLLALVDVLADRDLGEQVRSVGEGNVG